MGDIADVRKVKKNRKMLDALAQSLHVRRIRKTGEKSSLNFEPKNVFLFMLDRIGRAALRIAKVPTPAVLSASKERVSQLAFVLAETSAFASKN